jgi:hypothetical protein
LDLGLSRIQDSGFRIQDSGFRIQDSGFRIQDSGTTCAAPDSTRAERATQKNGKQAAARSFVK